MANTNSEINEIQVINSSTCESKKKMNSWNDEWNGKVKNTKGVSDSLNKVKSALCWMQKWEIIIFSSTFKAKCLFLAESLPFLNSIKLWNIHKRMNSYAHSYVDVSMEFGLKCENHNINTLAIHTLNQQLYIMAWIQQHFVNWLESSCVVYWFTV